MLVAQWDRVADLRGAQLVRTLLALDGVDDRNRELWTLGQCDMKLASIYGALFGSVVDATVRCGVCEETLEFETTLGALFGASDTTAAVANESDSLRIVHDAYDVTCRPLQLRDLLAMPPAPARARMHLLGCAVLEARRDGTVIPIEVLPASLYVMIGEAICLRDPHGETAIALACAACGSPNDVPFDMSTFLWEALERHVSRIFADVHTLARGYGWSEDAILALPDARRRRYLTLLAS